MTTRAHRASRLGFSAVALAYNLAIHRGLPQVTHLPANLAVAGGLVLLARAAGVSPDGLGLRPDRVPAGMRAGLLATVPIAAGVALTASAPATGGFYHDDRVTGAGTPAVLYRALVRTPLAIALPEEAIFRGALLGLFLQHHGPVPAVAMTSALFGLWHVLPTLDSLERNHAGTLVGEDPGRRAGTLAGVVLATMGAGAAFSWLRLRSGSIVAPVLAHTAINGLAFLAGHARHRARQAAGGRQP